MQNESELAAKRVTFLKLGMHSLAYGRLRMANNAVERKLRGSCRAMFAGSDAEGAGGRRTHAERPPNSTISHDGLASRSNPERLSRDEFHVLSITTLPPRQSAILS